MPTTSHQLDPRGFITPDAFNVAGELLGKPLATPSRRAAALIIDLLVVSLVTVVTRSFALLLGVVAALFFIRAGFKPTPVRGSVFGRAMRASAGCLGLFIGLITLLVWSSCGDFGEDRGPTINATIDGGGSIAGRVMGALATVGIMEVFEDAETLADVEEVAIELIETGEEIGIQPDQMQDFLMGAVPEDAPWAGEAEGLFARLLGTAEASTNTVDELDVREEVAGYETDEALRAYADVLSQGPDDSAARLRREALEARLSSIVAADTVDELVERVEELENENRSQQRDLENLTRALDDAESGGIFGWLRDTFETLTFGFGWLTLYWTILLSWWKGQTIGKRMMGLRVVRLDGEPITWWTAFERVGGYAAGFATGLLGFAQVYWDANRQAIHDRIVGTVVVVEGAPKVEEWESAL